MKNAFRSAVRGLLSVLCVAAISSFKTSAEGVPEPGLTLYGVVTNTQEGANYPLRIGHLRWMVKPPAGKGAPVIVETDLQVINDQYSYVLQIPFETVLGDFQLSNGALSMPATLTTYDRSVVSVEGQQATFVNPSDTTFTFSAADRGQIKRVDLTVSVNHPDTDKNGLPDYWEMKYFGHLGVDPNADPDQDGMSNLDEFRAGTDPTKYESQFRFIDVKTDQLGGIAITWSSVPGRLYRIQRSRNLTEGFSTVSPSEGVVGGGGEATSWRDSTAIGASPYFYRMIVVYKPYP